ncbi:hypothetical protein FKM82_000882 [Ascaphus truei]
MFKSPQVRDPYPYVLGHLKKGGCPIRSQKEGNDPKTKSLCMQFIGTKALKALPSRSCCLYVLCEKTETLVWGREEVTCNAVCNASLRTSLRMRCSYFS